MFINRTNVHACGHDGIPAYDAHDAQDGHVCSDDGNAHVRLLLCGV